MDYLLDENFLTFFRKRRVNVDFVGIKRNQKLAISKLFEMRVGKVVERG